MASPSTYRRGGSKRIAILKSLQDTDYASKTTMASFDKADELAELEATMAQSSKRLSKGKAGAGKSGGKTQGQKGKASTAAGKQGAETKAVISRASTANARVSKPKQASSRSASKIANSSNSTTTTTKPSPSSHPATRTRVTPATSLPTPSKTVPAVGSYAASAAMNWSRSSSPLSDVPDDLKLQDSSTHSPADSRVRSAEAGGKAAEPDLMSSVENATLNGDTETTEEATPPATFHQDPNSSGTPMEPDVTAETSIASLRNQEEQRAQGKDTQPIREQAQSQSEGGSEQPAVPLEVEFKPVRKRSAPKRYGASEGSANIIDPTHFSSDPLPEEEDADYHTPPRKKRRTSSTIEETPQAPSKRRQSAKKTGTTPKRTVRRPKTSDTSTASKSTVHNSSTKIVKLTISPPALQDALRARSVNLKESQDIPQTTAQVQAASRLPGTPESIAVEPVGPELAIDPPTLALSCRLTTREPLGSKPSAQGQPLVWAESRQALCETLPYFKRPQGGCYQNDGHVYGFLFDSVGHCREYLDEDIIICRAGGSMEQDPSGGMVQKKDQSMKEAQVLAILNDIAHQNPLIVICGNRNGGAKCEMPHQYSVLGWYKPVAVWEERTAGRGKKIWTTIKYRLERLNQAGETVPWHAPADSNLATLKGSANQTYRQKCVDCGKYFDQVYLQGWMCLNSACNQFWKLNGFDAPAGDTGLNYNPDFLLARAPSWGDESYPPAPVRPPTPDVGNILGDDLAYINTRGICCPKCGRCNSRRLFDRWVCENPACDFELRPQHRPVMPVHLHTPWDVAPTLVRNKVGAGVHLKVEHKYGYKVCTYTFDGIDGCFIHAAATKSILSAANGPDAMMADLQSQDLGLERRVFATTKMSGGRKVEDSKQLPPATPGAPPSPPQSQPPAEASLDSDESMKEKRVFEDGDLMTAFSMNYGMPYKFVASGASRAFEDSPNAVNDCRYRLNWAARALLNKPKEKLDFNEELIFTYLEGQKIEYHDDGEDGLGPEIASLSLGGRAKMHVRMKAKHYVGCSKTGILTEERPVPGSIDGNAVYQKRLAAWNDLQVLRLSDPAAYNKRRKELPKELGIFDKRTKKADDLVTVTLSHGDIMVMDGYDIQKYLEHKVVPEGYLRFALTCRTVLEKHLTEEERPGYVVEPDPGRYDGSVGY